jgi:dihydrofolate reductase
MAKLSAFSQISLDGYFVDAAGGMSWAHEGSQDPEWQAFVSGNASGDGALLFGRVTYEMMASYWPSPLAAQNSPDVAARMNTSRKLVFSRTLEQAAWQNTTLLKGELSAEVSELKQSLGGGITILGSGQLVAQLAQARLIDAYQFVVSPVVLGGGRSLFEGVKGRLDLKLEKTRAFANGKVVLWYDATRA